MRTTARYARPLTLCLVGALALIGTGCGSEAAPEATRAEALSESGSFSVTADPDTWETTVGQTSFVLNFADDKGPVHVDSVAVEPWMPAHGHGSSKTPVTTMKGHGVWLIEEVVYTMPGEWALNITAKIDGAEETFVLTVDAR